jgi:hypothetical protein
MSGSSATHDYPQPTAPSRSAYFTKPFRRESPESAKLVSSYYQARGKQCQKRIVGAGRPVREATNIAANADAQLDGKEIDPAGRKRRGPADQRKGTSPSMGDKSLLRNFTANCVDWGHTCAFEGSTWTGSEVARKGVGREDTFIDAKGLILETRQRVPQETERIVEFWL